MTFQLIRTAARIIKLRRASTLLTTTFSNAIGIERVKTDIYILIYQIQESRRLNMVESDELYRYENVHLGRQTLQMVPNGANVPIINMQYGYYWL